MAPPLPKNLGSSENPIELDQEKVSEEIFSSNNNLIVCGICDEEISPENLFLNLNPNCKHNSDKYCCDCIINLVSCDTSESVCPTCRKPIWIDDWVVAPKHLEVGSVSIRVLYQTKLVIKFGRPGLNLLKQLHNEASEIKEFKKEQKKRKRAEEEFFREIGL